MAGVPGYEQPPAFWQEFVAEPARQWHGDGNVLDLPECRATPTEFARPFRSFGGGA